MSFAHFSMHPMLLDALSAQGFIEPTPIQDKAVPPALAGHDLLGLARTGTGKTLAYVLPLLHKLLTSSGNGVRALVVAPTRELAVQIFSDIQQMIRKTDLSCVTIFGGVGLHTQRQQLKGDVDIVVACPGRLLDHVRRKSIDLSTVKMLVLDEADMMLDMGFIEDIQHILQLTEQRDQTLLFSATMPEELEQMAKEAMNSPLHIQVDTIAPVASVSHAIYPIAQHLKTPLLKTMLRLMDFQSLLVFVRTRHGAKRLWRQLGNAGFAATCLQGKLSQRRRQEAMCGFRRGKYAIMVATDIAARGLDISCVSHVINYDFPPTVDTYIHRIGRTGRASATGSAFTFVSPEDAPMMKTLERALDGDITYCYMDEFDYSAQRRSTAAKPAKLKKQPRPQRIRKKGTLLSAEQVTPRNRPARQTMPGRPQSQARIISKPTEKKTKQEVLDLRPASRTTIKQPHSPRKLQKLKIEEKKFQEADESQT
ncbi:DEAD/DEAH box helicase [Halodesulfovibrio marinisediminis]|uniref:Superfamily II DNA and RNA helicase n=1 Tax=Halodesulfovibrio marinisediminis DSM 17456 TaxID=1121457 RepID=A0A1N6IF14_9BACT|nr:DEAD/DEAH box helicase [Halodesulfovibrio marinisediminis]SIO30612.1 Superfamily II DNA and RNA helicase [Halodesulfovibrio marinisediminis DSM 17456]